MTWVPLILLSAFFLALYDLAKKESVRENSVIPVLLISTVAGAAAFALALGLAGQLVAALRVSSSGFWLISIKSLMLVGSWTLGYYALRALPLSIAAPIRSSAPLWTLLGAILFFGEIPTPLQAIGMAAILIGYAIFSYAGEHEGIDFVKNKAIAFVFLGTILGAASALFDKYLIQTCGIHRNVVQLWYMLDLTVIFAGVYAVQRWKKLSRTPFHWRWTIPCIGIVLMAAEWFYFDALSEKGMAVSVLSLIRRSNVVLTFTASAFLFEERNYRRKIPALLAILIGVALLCLARK